MKIIRCVLLITLALSCINFAQAQKKKKKQEDAKVDKAVEAVAAIVKD